MSLIPTPSIQSPTDLPRLTTTTFIGIMVAILGNILISLALNVQKLAHKRVKSPPIESNNDRNTKRTRRSRENTGPSLDENDEAYLDSAGNVREDGLVDSSYPSPLSSAENQASISFPRTSPQVRDYGAVSSNSTPTGSPGPHLQPRLTHSFPSKRLAENRLRNGETTLLQVDVVSEETALHGSRRSRKDSENKKSIENDENEGEYLKSKLWWLGFLLMNIGELGNFISYAYAPASVVAPLGTFALIANCIFAPVLIGERFRKRDLLGISIAIIGAVTVVLSTNAKDTRMDRDALLHAITQIPFVIYSCIYIVLAIILSTLSRGKFGQRWVFIDVGICAIFGGFTVLSTKAISTLLTMEWIEMFKQWITYPILVVLIGTGVGQIRYLNRALMRFDSKVVIPIQFVLFTLSAITGSAILYGDFERAQFHEVITFLYGCAATFAGVFIIAWAPNQSESEDGELGTDPETASGLIHSSPELIRAGLGTPGRRPKATLVLPNGASGKNIMKRRRSALSLIGISPVQHLLLVHTPPRDIPIRMRDENYDEEFQRNGRRRTMSWYGQQERAESRTESSGPTASRSYEEHQ